MITFLKNKSLFITIFSFLIFGCNSVPDGMAVKNQSKIPLWTSYDTISHVFPNSDYIARIGHGDNAESAKLNADSELASYFNHSVKTDIVARQNYSNQKGKSDIQKYLTKNISVQNDVEVIGLKHTDFYFDSAHNDFIVCSFINRNDAWKLLEPKLVRAVNFINTRGKSVDIICDEDTPPADTFTLRIQKYLSDHIDNPDLSRSMAADYLHMNPDYLSSLFHRQFGQTFNTYITARRIDRAKELLINTDFSLSLISQKCGFSSSSYFNKTFKKEAGITPQQYRSGFGTRRKGVQDGTNSDNT